MILVTASGTKYHVKDSQSGRGKEVKRLPSVGAGVAVGDYHWIKFVFAYPIEIGKPVEFIMEPSLPDTQIRVLRTSNLTGVIY